MLAGAGERRCGTEAARFRPGVSPGSTICRDAPRCSARPRPPDSGTRRRCDREVEAGRAVATRARRGGGGGGRGPDLRRSAASRPAVRTRPASRLTRRARTPGARRPTCRFSVDHAMAAGHRGRVYVAGGYGARSRATDVALRLHRRRVDSAGTDARAEGSRRCRSGEREALRRRRHDSRKPEARQDDARVRHREEPVDDAPRPDSTRAPRRRRAGRTDLRSRRANCRLRHEHGHGRAVQPAHGPLVSAPESPGTARRHRRGGHGPLDRVRRRRGARGNDPHRVPIRRHPPSLVAAPEPSDSQARARRRRSRPEGLRDRRRDEPGLSVSQANESLAVR